MEYPVAPKVQFEFIGAGASGKLYFLPPDRVVKLAHVNWHADIEHERKIFEVLEHHPRIAKYFGIWNSITYSIILEYYPRGCVRQILSQCDPSAVVHKWALQIVEGIIYVHSKGVVHGDLNASNILVTQNDNIVLCDFAGSSLEGETPATLCYERRHLRPRKEGEEDIRNIDDDLFALGSVLYELFTLQQPYTDREDYEVEQLYQQGVFPDVTGIPIGDIILKCWTGKYKSAIQVLADLQPPSVLSMLYGRILNLPLNIFTTFRWIVSWRRTHFSRFATWRW